MAVALRATECNERGAKNDQNQRDFQVKGIQLIGYGNPAEVVKLIDVADVGTPERDEIVIDVEAASATSTSITATPRA
jgi:hypothetical protein